jgi:hypothetical protein
MVATIVCNPTYSVRFFNRAGAPIAVPPTPLSVSWGRRLDDISSASIIWSVSGDDCCDELGGIEPIAHFVGIYRENGEVWYGTVKMISYGFSTIELRADDALFWLTRRRIHNDLTLTSMDLSDQFQAIYDDAMAPDPLSQFAVVRTGTGVYESRTVQVRDYRTAWNVIQEMLVTGLDVTTLGRTIYAGVVQFRPLVINLRDVQGDPRITKDGGKYANSVTMDASDTVNATYPSGDPTANASYPLTEIILKDSQVQDVTSATNAAKARYEYSRQVPRLVSFSDGIQLGPESGIDVSTLLCGQLITVNSEGLCYAQRESFRLGGVDVTMAGGVELVKLSLQPVGPIASLEDAGDPVF